MPLTFDTGMPYKCPDDGRLIMIIVNDKSSIDVRFLSYAPGSGEYRGLKKLSYLADVNGSYVSKGLSFGKQPLNTTPYPEVVNAILMLVINCGRYAIDSDFKLNANDPIYEVLSKEFLKRDRVVTVLRALDQPANYAPI